MNARAYAYLLRWLGPWTPGDAVPDDVVRSQIDLPFRTWIYRPRRTKPIGTYVLAHGLHFDGPADHRMVRFASILAGAGFIVVIPFLPGYTSMVVDETAITDFARAFEAVFERGDLVDGRAPGVFSISFGCLPAIRLASAPQTRERVGALVLFGAYADFADAMRFCMGVGDPDLPRDVLNQPAVFMNLLHEADEAIHAAWLEYVRATWSRPEMKTPERYRPVAERIAAALDEAHRELFLIGCDVLPGAFARVEQALDEGIRNRTYLDPRPHMQGIRCPVRIIHGMDDDVIPPTHLGLLRDAMPTHVDVRAGMTGLYGHSSPAGGTSLRDGLQEGRSMIGILRAIVQGGTRPRT